MNDFLNTPLQLHHAAAPGETETLFRALADTAPVLIWMSGPDKGGIYFNKAWRDYTGRSMQQELGEGWFDNVHPDDMPALEACSSAFARHEPFTTEFRMRRHDGTWRWMLDTGVPRFSADGRLAGYVGSCVDITERREAEQALREREERLTLAQEAAGVGTYDWDVQAGIIRWSPEMYRLHGIDPGTTGERLYQAWLAALHPEDRERADTETRAFLEREGPLEIEFRVVLPDGGVRWIQGRGRMERDDEGRPIRMIGVNMDITCRKSAEEHQQLLVNELNHRVKNTLATVQSLAVQTLRGAGSAEAFRQSFEARLMALATAHDLLTQENWKGAWLNDLLETEFAPYRGGTAQEQVLLTGQPVHLDARETVTLAMAFHELATNAVKYGALSVPAGRVEVGWQAQGGEGEGKDRLVLRWRETGGPPVRPPERRGFGSRLVERSIAHDLEGTVRFEFLPPGVCCTVEIPLAGMRAVSQGGRSHREQR